MAYSRLKKRGNAIRPQVGDNLSTRGRSARGVMDGKHLGWKAGVPFAGTHSLDVLRPRRLEQAMGSGEHVKRRGQRRPAMVREPGDPIRVSGIGVLGSPSCASQGRTLQVDSRYVFCDTRCL